MDYLFTPAPAAEALAFIKAKAPLARADYEQMLPELRALAFTVSGIKAHDALQDIRDTVAKLPEGALFKDVQKEVAGKLASYLEKPDPGLFPETPEELATRQTQLERRAQFLIRTHGNQAYAIAAHKDLDESKDLFPYWKYLTVGDEAVRETHAALEGITLPHDDPFWQHHYPPWEFGCRCQVVPVTRREYEEMKGKEDEEAIPADQRQTLTDEMATQLANERKLTRSIAGVPTPVDLRAPVEKQHDNDVYIFNPRQFQLPLKSLQARYDQETWTNFVKWAGDTQYDEGKTIWQWLNTTVKAPRAPRAPRVRKPAGDGAFPDDLAALKAVKSLGGSTGAMLMQGVDGTPFVMKRGNSAAHITEEATADRLYDALGVPVAPARLYETAQGPAKLTRYIKGSTLDQYLGAASEVQKEAVLAKIREGFVADALLGNWDVAGLNLDNILVDANGTPLRIDNGGSLRYRAQGAKKKASEFGHEVTEINTLRDAKHNAQTARLFAELTDAEISGQVQGVLDKREALLAAAPDDLKATLNARLDWLADKYAPKDFTPQFAQHVQAARLSGVTHLGDKDMVEDTAVLFWQEKDGQGNLVTRAKMRLTAAGSDAIIKTLGPELQALTPLSQGVRTVPGDVYWPKIENALKNINHHATDGAYNAAKMADMQQAKTALEKLQHAAGATPEEKQLAAHYLPIIHQAGEAMKAKTGTPIFSQYEPPAPKTTPARRSGPEIKTETLKWNAKALDRGHATQGTQEVWKQQAYRVGDKDGFFHFLPWTEVNGAPSAAPYAFRGLVEITIPGAASVENLQKAAQLMADAGVVIAPVPPAYGELVYLRKGLDLMSADLDAAKTAAWKAIADSSATEAEKVSQLKNWISSGTKIKLADKNYQPDGKANSFAQGWKTWERFDLPRAEVEKKMKGYALVHDVGGDITKVVDSILSGGGQFTPTMERLRAGVPLSTGGASSVTDMGTGGANYIFTRIKSEAGVERHRGFVFKIGNLSRMDHFSFDGDKYGDVRPPGQNTHGIDPRTARATTLTDFKANAKKGSNETIFKNGLPFLDEIEHIRCTGEAQRREILEVFRKHQYTHLPDGRAIEDVVKI